MNILYIWIKEYVNIKEQGFMTTSEYNIKGKMEFNEGRKGKDKFSLYIENNKNYITKFFNTNQYENSSCIISNVITIIG